MERVVLRPYLTSSNGLEVVQRRVKEFLKKGETVQLDFTGVRSLSSLTVIELFTHWVERVGIEGVDSYLICVGVTDRVYEQINCVLDNHRNYATYTEYRA